MEDKINSLHTRKKKTRAKDPCPVCDKELYHNKYYSKRIGLFDINSESHEILGWSCPHCDSEFDKLDNIMYIYGQKYAQGES